MYSQETLRRRGVAAVIVVLVVIAAVVAAQKLRPDHRFTLTLRTADVAAGIVSGSRVRLNGVDVGTVDAVERLGNGQQGVVLKLAPGSVAGLSDSVEPAFSAGNLFGVSEVELIPHTGGDRLADGAILTPQRPITDNTVAKMIATLGDVNSDAIRPHMSAILSNVDASTRALTPLMTALGAVAQEVQDTQRLPTSTTFPALVAAIEAGDGAVRGMLTAFRGQWATSPNHDYAHGQHSVAGTAAIDGPPGSGSLTDEMQRILNPAATEGLAAAAPVVEAPLRTLLDVFPNGAGRTGLQLAQLKDNLRRAMPDTPSGPVLDVLLSVQYPAIGAMLPR